MDLFDCTICLTDMMDRKPRFLSCHHSFCTQCLQQLLKDNKILCPTCREVTQVKSGNVSELKIDFKLAQMRESQQKNKAKQPETEIAKPVCQICQQEDALYKCKECNEFLCKSCKVKHCEIEEFKSHVVLELCQKHQDGATHLCSMCVMYLCRRCMMLEHSDHKQHFKSYNAGIAELTQKTESEKEALTKNFNKISTEYKESTSEQTKITAISNSLKEEEKNLLQKLENNRRLQKMTSKQDEDFMKLQQMYTETETEYNVAMAALNSLTQSKEGFCQKYHKLTLKAKQVTDKMQKTRFTYTIPDSLKQYLNIPDKQKYLKLSKLGLEKNIKCSLQGDVIGDDILMINSAKTEVLRLNQAGDVVKSYKPPNTGKIWGVTVHANCVYILQSKYITVIAENQKTDVYQHPVSNDYMKILVKNKDQIYISDYENPGNIYQLNPKLKKTDVVVQGLNKPEYMSSLHCDDGIRFIVTEYDDRRIRVYDEGWQELYRFGSPGSGELQFREIWDIAVTDMKTLLITDNGNTRVSHYTIEGRLLSHLVTKDDGLQNPTALAYKFPYLWIGSSENVKCYKLQY